MIQLMNFGKFTKLIIIFWWESYSTAVETAVLNLAATYQPNSDAYVWCTKWPQNLNNSTQNSTKPKTIWQQIAIFSPYGLVTLIYAHD